jgi:hypothetical protein
MPIDYNLMLNYYNSDQLIPIIGGELLKIRKGIHEDGQDRLLTFEQYVIEKMTNLFIEDPNCPNTMSELALKLPSLSSNDITAIYRQIPFEDVIAGQVKKIVDLDKFNLFISTSYDRKLEEAMAADNSLKAEPIIWTHLKREPLVINLEKPTRKIIYLFGAVGKGPLIEEVSINDEDKLEALFSMSLVNSRYMSTVNEAFSLLEFLKNKILLFIGNNFQDSFMRFMVRTLYNSPYKKDINTIYIVNDKRNQLGFERYFFEKYGIKIIHDSPIDEVVDNLYNLIKGQEEFKERYKQGAFVSYDRNFPLDKACGIQTNGGLRNAGIKSWLDTKELKIEEHKKEIRRVIGAPETSIFIPVLSKNLINKSESESYVKSVEWEMAKAKLNLHESQMGKNTMNPFFIVPVAVEVLDKADIEKLPDFIRKYNIRQCSDPTLIHDIKDLLKKIDL